MPAEPPLLSASPSRSTPASRPADGRSRHRRAGRDLEAQRAVPARRLSLLLLRHHGCDRRQPLPERRRLPARASRSRRSLHRLPASKPSSRSSASSGRPARSLVTDAGDDDAAGADHIKKLGGVRRVGVEARFPAGVWRCDTAGWSRQHRPSAMRSCRWSGCAPARRRHEIDYLRARLRPRRRGDAGGIRGLQARPHQGRDHRDAAPRRSRTAAWCSTIA